MKKKILYTLISLFFLIVIIEGIARLILSVPSMYYRIGRENDSSRRLDWIRRHQNQNINYSFDIYNPSTGWISRPNLRNVSVFGGKILNTNAKGFRGQVDYSYGKDPQKTRILMLGDSFTFGENVSDNETYSHYLQQMFPNAEIINAGIHGYGYDQMLVLLKEEGIKYNPDIVILGFNEWDIERSGLKFRDYAKPKFEIENGKLTVTNYPVPDPESVLKWEWARPKIIDIYVMSRHRFIVSSGMYEKRVKELTRFILDKIVRTVNATGAAPIFVYMPIGKEIIDTHETTRGEDYFLDYCRSNGKVECISLRPYFKAKVDEGVKLKLAGHWCPLGHLAAAEGIRDYLLNKKHIIKPLEMPRS